MTQQLVWFHRTMAGPEGNKIPMPSDPVYPTEEFREDIEADDDAKFWSEIIRDNPNLRGAPAWN